METKTVIAAILILLAIVTLLIFAYGFRDYLSWPGGVSWSSFLTLPRIDLNKSTGGVATGIDNATQEVSDIMKPLISGNLPSGYTEDDLSPFYGRVSLSASSISEETNPFKNPSVIRLSVRVPERERVNVTGWKIQGNKNALLIPRAVADFIPPSGGGEGDIVLAEGNHNINIYSSLSVINKNLQTNRCIGYIERSYNFNPSLGGSCPGIPRDDYRHLPGVCQDYINSYNGSCRNPFEGQESNYLSDDCKFYLRELNYSACYEREHLEKDFLSRRWYLWVGVNVLDSRHDRLLLFDRDNKLVDEYVY